jgi:hypothetical protein
MTPRARRAVIGATALVAVVVAVLVVAHWDTVRDHVEAWHFQLTRDTRTIDPSPEGMSERGPAISEKDVLHFVADRLRCPMILDQRDGLNELAFISGNSVRELFENEGWRVLEQRLPRRAFVLIRVHSTTEEEDIDRLLDHLREQEESETKRP